MFGLKRARAGQISAEYLIVVGFITFFVITILGVAFFYASQVQDSMRADQVEHFARKIISSAEAVHYAGEPSKSTISAYLPSGVTGVVILDDEIVFNLSLSSGRNIISYASKVPLEGNISSSEGVKTIEIVALPDKSLITSN
jgi:uncharacterized protein (UPF0333 family)